MRIDEQDHDFTILDRVEEVQAAIDLGFGDQLEAVPRSARVTNWTSTVIRIRRDHARLDAIRVLTRSAPPKEDWDR